MWSWRVARGTSGKEKLALGAGLGAWSWRWVLGTGVVRSKSIKCWRGMPRPVLERYWLVLAGEVLGWSSAVRQFLT